MLPVKPMVRIRRPSRNREQKHTPVQAREPEGEVDLTNSVVLLHF